MNHRQNSKICYIDAKKYFPGGVNSPVRNFNAVDGEPVFIVGGRGSRLYDVDQNEYIDYVGSWGASILGHAHPEVVQAVKDAAEKGLTFGAPTPQETLLAQKITKLVPSMEMMRFVSSGTEACMAAIRVARGYTGKSKIIKFDGNYHGHADMLLVKAGSGVATFGIPGSAGVPPETASQTLTATYNNLDSVKALFQANPNQIAAVMIEALAGNCGFIRPQDGFLESLQSLCHENGALLIMDEVMTGFRVALGGMQGLKGFKPDLSTFGKVVGGGMPLAVYGGRREIMEVVAPLGAVYQAGTLSGNPVAVASGLKTLEVLERDRFFESLNQKTRTLCDGLAGLAKEYGVPFAADCQGGMFGFFFREGLPQSFDEAKVSDRTQFIKFFQDMLAKGVYLAPSAYEAGFVSSAHTDEDIQTTLRRAEESFRHLRNS